MNGWENDQMADSMADSLMELSNHISMPQRREEVRPWSRADGDPNEKKLELLRSNTRSSTNNNNNNSIDHEKITHRTIAAAVKKNRS